MSPCELSLRKTQMERTNIPYDIMVGILSRLPANSLLRLRWACKYLFDLITRDDDFIKLHLHCSTTTTSDHDSSVLSSATYSKSNDVGNYNLQCYLNYTTCSFSCYKQIIACPLESRNEHVKLINGINGLLFFRIKHDLDSTFCIWNPCTNEYRVLSVPVPDPPMIIKDKKRCVGRYGFGYDHTINDYKVVRNDYYDNGASDVQIYTLGTNSWRSIGPAPYEQPAEPLLKGGVFVNGALHWLLDPLGKKIVSFDIGKEEYKEVLIEQLHPRIPPHGTWECTMELQVFEGSLCCLVAQHTNNSAAKHKHHFVMWKMKDYDVNNNKYSWTKLFKTSTAKYRRLTLLRLTQDGEILMLKGGNLVVYDPYSGTSRTLIKICEEKECYHVIDAVYTESLVSLNSGTYYYTGRLKNRKRKNDQR